MAVPAKLVNYTTQAVDIKQHKQRLAIARCWPLAHCSGACACACACHSLTGRPSYLHSQLQQQQLRLRLSRAAGNEECARPGHTCTAAAQVYVYTTLESCSAWPPLPSSPSTGWRSWCAAALKEPNGAAGAGKEESVPAAALHMIDGSRARSIDRSISGPGKCPRARVRVSLSHCHCHCHCWRRYKHAGRRRRCPPVIGAGRCEVQVRFD